MNERERERERGRDGIKDERRVPKGRFTPPTWRNLA